MGKLSAFRIKGLTLTFNSLDHKPSRSSKFEGLSSKLEKVLLAKVLEHKLALLAEWQDKVDQKEII